MPDDDTINDTITSVEDTTPSGNDTIITYHNDGDVLQADVENDNINAILERIRLGNGNITQALTALIEELDGKLQTLDSVVMKLSGNQTITGTKNFTGTVKVPNSTSLGSALSLQYYGIDSSNDYEKNCIQVGNLIVQWGRTGEVSKNQQKTITFKRSFKSPRSYGFAFSYHPSGMITTGNGLANKQSQSCIVNCYADANNTWSPTITWIAVGV